MEFGFRFGTMDERGPAAEKMSPERFRLVVLGDFTCRGERGAVGTDSALAARKPRQVDVDNLDRVLGRFEAQLSLPLSGEEAGVSVSLRGLDDLHPDSLFENVPVFHELATLRRRINNPSTFAAAADQLQSWWGDLATPRRTPETEAATGADVPDGDLDDLARLLGRESTTRRIEQSVEQLARELVAPYVVPSREPAQDEMIAAIDQSLSATMRQILHHRDFRTLESLWRGADLLTRRLETGADLRIYLVDLSAQEFAADLSATEQLDQTALYRLLVAQPRIDEQFPAPSAIIAHYTFNQTAGHASLLGRAAQIAAAAGAPLLAAIDAACLQAEESTPPDEAVQRAWSALRKLPAARYLGLAAPGFLLRMPYGKNASPIESFAFEEVWPPGDLAGLLWGNPAVAAGLLLGQSFTQHGLRGMQPGAPLRIDDIPFYCYRDEDGEQVAAPCTRLPLTDSMAEAVTAQGVMPLRAIRGRNEVQLAGFQSLAGTRLAGPWDRS